MRRPGWDFKNRRSPCTPNPKSAVRSSYFNVAGVLGTPMHQRLEVPNYDKPRFLITMHKLRPTLYAGINNAYTSSSQITTIIHADLIFTPTHMDISKDVCRFFLHNSARPGFLFMVLHICGNTKRRLGPKSYTIQHPYSRLV